MLNINKEQLIAQIKWFSCEVEEAFPPCKMLRPSFAIAKDVIEFGYDVLSFILPIAFEYAIDLGSDIWTIVTSEEAVHFYAMVITNVINFVKALVSLYEMGQEVKAEVIVYVAADSEKKNEMQYLVRSFVFHSFLVWFHSEFDLLVNQIKDCVEILKSGRLFVLSWIDFEIQAIVYAWTSQWV